MAGVWTGRVKASCLRAEGQGCLRGICFSLTK